jgi:enoyl-CoA hydratase/carnithine racemase
MSDDVLAAARDGVLRVTLNRLEKRNPLSRAALARLREVFAAHRDTELSLVVLRGAGDQSFAAGGDLRDLEQVRTPEEARALHDLGGGALQAIRDVPAPRAQSQARDAELFARAWCHADHWAAAENILSKEASR